MSGEHVGGAGPDVVLLHGLGSRWQVFAPIIEALERHHRVHAIDLPGFGARGSDPLPDGSVMALADWVAAELKSRGITSPHVVGSSMGGGIALELARRNVAGRVTAFAPIGYWNLLERIWSTSVLTVLRTAARHLRAPLSRAMSTRSGRVLLLSLLFGKPANVDSQAALDDLDALAASGGFRAARDDFRHVAAVDSLNQVPTTVVWGRRDMILLTLPQSRRARRALPGARHVLLGGCGHLPFSDAPDRCVAVITDERFLGAY